MRARRELLVACLQTTFKADNSQHNFNYYNFTNAMITASDNALANDYQPTMLDIGYTTFDNADVRVLDDNFVTYCGYNWDGATNYYALAECTFVNADRECGQFGVRFDTSDTDTFTATRRQALACQEFGHTVGLRHRDGGCLTGAATQNNLTDHDRSHISANY